VPVHATVLHARGFLQQRLIDLIEAQYATAVFFARRRAACSSAKVAREAPMAPLSEVPTT